MGLFGIIEIASFATAIMLGLVLAFVPLGVYVVGRWREDKTGRAEPYLGFVTLFGLIAYLGFTLAIVSVQMIIAQLIGGHSELTMPLALLVSGLIVFVPALLVVRPRGPSRAARLYVGLAVLGSSLSTVFAIVGLMMMLFMGESRALGVPVAMLVANLPVVILGGMRIARPQSIDAPAT